MHNKTAITCSYYWLFDYRAVRQTIMDALNTSNSAFEEALNQHITWTPDAAAALETSIRSSPILAGCSTDQVRKQY